MFKANPEIVANGGFFSLFNLPPTVFDWNVLTRLADAMSSTQLPGSSRMASGLVYLGQFITHDVTRLRLPDPPRTFVPAFDLLQDRSPAIDLDHVYGQGWGYAHGAIDHETGKMLLDWTVDTQQQPVAADDLPRHPDRSARTPDDRNDENLLLAQLHVQFLKVHNVLVDRIRQVDRIADPRQLFERARFNLILYYQQVVLYDFLEDILDRAVWEHVILNNRGTLWTPVRAELARMPVEFAAAAFRFAHAMVRSSYTVNDRCSVSMAELFQMTGRGGFKGHSALPHTHVVDWRMFFADPRRGEVSFFNHALPIDPTVMVSSPQAPQLAMADLRTGNRVLLADAQTIITHIRRAHRHLADVIGLEALSPRDLNPEVMKGDKVQGLLDVAGGDGGLSLKTPLWYYVLAEAYAVHQGDRLGPLGSLIVAETLRALVSLSSPSILAGDRPGSYVDPSGNSTGAPHVRMIDLLAAAAEPSAGAQVFRPERYYPPLHTSTRPTVAAPPLLETQS